MEPVAVTEEQYIGKRIRFRRKVLGLTQKELADACGNLSFQQIQKYEYGRGRIAATLLKKLADILKVPIGYFFAGLPDYPVPAFVGVIDPDAVLSAPDVLEALAHILLKLPDYERLEYADRLRHLMFDESHLIAA